MKISKDIITSRKNPLVMLAASLTEKKYRDEHCLFSAAGYKLCREAVAAKAPVVHVLVTEEYAKAHLSELLALFSGEQYEGTLLSVLSEGCFDKITTEKAPEGIILLIKYLDISKKYNKIINVGILGENTSAIFLHSIRDPGNLGTVLRTAGAFGTGIVLMSDDCADPYHPRAVRAAMGAVFRVPTLRVSDVAGMVAEIQKNGRRVLAAELRPHSVALFDADLKRSDVVMIGNEGHGIPEEISALCDAGVFLPIAENSESLNAAAAATVFLWEQGKLK